MASSNKPRDEFVEANGLRFHYREWGDPRNRSVVLCVHGGQTPREVVLRASERLRQSNIPVLGAILNNLDLQQYGYSFKKSYYDYYDEESRSSKDQPAKRVG